MHEKNYKQSLATLEDLNRKKSMFISTLSHDFRTSAYSHFDESADA